MVAALLTHKGAGSSFWYLSHSASSEETAVKQRSLESQALPDPLLNKNKKEDTGRF